MRLEGQMEKTEEKNLSLFFSFDFRQEPSFFISDHQKKYFFFPNSFLSKCIGKCSESSVRWEKSLMSIFSIT